MIKALVHTIITVISDCIVTLFAYWLRNRNDK
ncbi:type I toxin-antitoxin system Fst family toxin [Staphylococcus equorum]|uniref:Type I toxin-antitoxin system Fst family toxin n=1 Tax=Staphylococcus equorum TaxID=246432 RepID=A0A9X4LD59_9STAP|nr:type I toxin-antitoxin system Fst family toxin [Staphylococcus equorum]MDG0842377.1 type I toxin-antitoxin system Fst family toxin [Staphylococcus equorum]MDG0858490.1 type I toxin-antitoxin system Fst family toxin [Staphylococcus equorum]